METYAVDSATGSSAGLSGGSFDRMTSADFLELLVTELKQQDPFEPSKTSDMISQVSQIRDIEQSTQLISTLQNLTQQQHTGNAGGLLGKYVEAIGVAADGTATIVSGVVTGVRFGSDGTAVLELDSGQLVLAANVTRIMTAEQAELATTAGDDDANEADEAAA
jgi:flagellar basal-body rod modification protein FlgD